MNTKEDKTDIDRVYVCQYYNYFYNYDEFEPQYKYWLFVVKYQKYLIKDFE